MHHNIYYDAFLGKKKGENIMKKQSFKLSKGMFHLPLRERVRGKNPAFTLAEVLITLGIIGVVAAITMPTLIQNHRKQETVTKLKKIYSMVNQAIKLSEVEYGEHENWDMDCGTSMAISCTTEQAIEKFNTYIGKHLEIIEIKPNDEDTGFFVYLKDGSILYIYKYLYDMDFYLNKKAVQNKKSGINHFYFRFNAKLPAGQTLETNRDFNKGMFEPYSNTWNGTRDTLKSGDIRSCNGEYHSFCAKLIQYDGWQIKDDYPLRF